MSDLGRHAEALTASKEAARIRRFTSYGEIPADEISLPPEDEQSIGSHDGILQGYWNSAQGKISVCLIP